MSFLQVMAHTVYPRQTLGDELRKHLKSIVRVVLQLLQKTRFQRRFLTVDKSYFIVIDKRPLVKPKQKTINKVNRPMHQV